MLKLLLPLLLTPLLAYSASERFYIGTYSGVGGRGEGIYTAVLDSDTGRIGPVTLAAKAANPGYLAMAPDGKHLYAVTSDDGGSDTAFTVAKTGTLSLINHVYSGGPGPCYVSVEPSGRNVLTANYSGGDIAAIRVDPDGQLGHCSSVAFHGSGPNPIRQTQSYAHFVATDSSGKFLYVCDLGTDHVWTYQFDPVTGKIGQPAALQGMVPRGSGARHLAFGPGDDFVYVNGEMGRNISTFRRDKSTGALTLIQTLPLVPGAGPAPTITTAEVLCDPSRGHVYVSSRGDDILAAFSIGPDGRLTFIQDIPCEVKFSRGFGIDPTGRWLIIGGQNDGRLAVFSIDPATGKLASTGQSATAPSPVCVIFAPIAPQHSDSPRPE